MEMGYLLPLGGSLFTKADCALNGENKKPCRGRTSFPLCKDITCRDEWFHSICCVEIGQTKLDGSRLILESNTYYVTLPK